MSTDCATCAGPSATEGTSAGHGRDSPARIERLLEVVQQFAFLDFSEVAPVGEAGDELDALAAMVNLLGEELERWNADFKDRVERRTAELTAASERLAAEVGERRRAEEQLAAANADLADHVGHLRRLNNQVRQLTEMSHLLQAAGGHDEALDIVTRFAPDVFTGAGGAIYVATPTRSDAQLVRSWGRQQGSSPSVTIDSCAALRQGGIRRGEGFEDAHCSHLPPGLHGRILCIPLTAQGEAIGLLSLLWEHDPMLLLAADAPDHARQPSGLDSQRVAVAAAEQLALTLAHLSLRSELRSQSIRDALTGLYNRRYLDETLARELHGAQRADLSVSVLMVDIDHFKGFNDAYGHPAGDTVLSEVAQVLLDTTRSGDIVCRYGGEEFAIIMTGADEAVATARAARIRGGIAQHVFHPEDGPSSHLTVSIGVATRPQDGTSPHALLRSADTALYRAKAVGRNRVESASHSVNSRSPAERTSVQPARPTPVGRAPGSPGLAGSIPPPSTSRPTRR